MTRFLLIWLVAGLASQVQADERNDQFDHGAYRNEIRAYRPEPRSLYPQNPLYQRNLAPQRYRHPGASLQRGPVPGAGRWQPMPPTVAPGNLHPGSRAAPIYQPQPQGRGYLLPRR